MKSLLLLIEGDDELRPVVKELQATTVTGAQNPFERTLSNKTKIIAVTTGVGPEQAYRVTADAIREFSPDYVLSAGTCGALVQGLEVSDWVVSQEMSVRLARHISNGLLSTRFKTMTKPRHLVSAKPSNRPHGDMRDDW